MGWIAGRDIELTVDGETVTRKQGEPVPEVEDWPSPEPWISRGHVVWVDDAKPLRAVTAASRARTKSTSRATTTRIRVAKEAKAAAPARPKLKPKE